MKTGSTVPWYQADAARPWRRRLLVCWTLLGLGLAATSIDTYNTLNQRAFLDLLALGNPYSLAPTTVLTFRGETWPVDWPYPPFTILFVLPAWVAYRVTGLEPLFQLLFKLPLLAGVVASAVFSSRLATAMGRNTPGRMWFLFNPAVLVLAALTGGFDAALMGLLVASIYYLIGRPRPWLSATLLGACVGLRLYPVVLVPVVALWIWRRNGWGATARYVGIAAAVVAAGLWPAILDPSNFLATLATQHQLGPFSASLVLAKVLNVLHGRTGIPLAPAEASFVVLVVVVVVTLVGVYALTARQELDPLEGCVAALLVFYALYPKMHGLYVLGVFPLALLAPSRLATIVWLPGFLWYLLFNGRFGATGLPYFVAPLTGSWVDSYRLVGLPESLRLALQGGLILAYTALTLGAGASILRRRSPQTASVEGPEACLKLA